MVNEVVRYLVTLPDGIYVDGTVGSGGHSEAIGGELASKGHLICLDRDPEAIRLSKERLSSLREGITLIRANYAALNSVFEDLGLEKVNGIFLDLGVSSYQLEQAGRGFSFNRDEPLDMRMDPDDEVSAHRLINSLPVKELEKILREYGEERRAKAIVKVIDRERKKRPIDSSLRLADLVKTVIPHSRRPGARHPATRTFQALRIAVNRELENLENFLENVPPLLVEGGRLVILSYHSLEDRLVKQSMAKWEKGCTCPSDLPRCTCGNKPLFKRVYKKGMKPGQRELDENPRARSATLRAAERI
jgi:16S rRNA (cytosine1402-N4)-methyltransferase